MASMGPRLACAALLACFLGVNPAHGEDNNHRAPSDGCGHAAALQAAKDALARGDQAAAVSYLRRAKALLDACAEPPAPDQSREGEDRSFARAHSEPRPA